MPSTLPLPTLSDYVSAFHDGVRAKRDRRADAHSGASYNYIAGASAMLMARESAYVRDLFRAIYFGAAEGDELTELVAERFQIARVLDTFGTGFATLARPTNAAGGDTIWEGTRILIATAGASALSYAVARNTTILPGATYVAGLPIRATTRGVGTAIDTSVSGQAAAFDDPIWDPSWKVTSVRCADGTTFEKAADFRARVLATLQTNQVGYQPGIAAACASVGAANVAVFGTNFGGVDLGGCATYVGDTGFNGSTSLVRAVTLKLESVRMLGPDMLIGPMVQSPLSIGAAVQLYDDPSKFDIDTIAAACSGAIRRVFGATGAYSYDVDALFGAVVDVSDAIQDVTFTNTTTPGSPAPLVSQGLLVPYPPPSGGLWFPLALSRYSIPANGITFAFVGPS